MLSDTERDALDATRQNIEATREFIKDLTVDSFEADRLRIYATTRALEIISEASRRLPDDFKVRYPAIDWRAIRDAGNAYRQAYARVISARIWDTACYQLDSLFAVVSRALDDDRQVGPLPKDHP